MEYCLHYAANLLGRGKVKFIPELQSLEATRVTTRDHPAAECGTVGEKCPVILPKFRFARYI
jgi:hypothetical protein